MYGSEIEPKPLTLVLDSFGADDSPPRQAELYTKDVNAVDTGEGMSSYYSAHSNGEYPDVLSDGDYSSARTSLLISRFREELYDMCFLADDNDRGGSRARLHTAQGRLGLLTMRMESVNEFRLTG